MLDYQQELTLSTEQLKSSIDQYKDYTLSTEGIVDKTKYLIGNVKSVLRNSINRIGTLTLPSVSNRFSHGTFKQFANHDYVYILERQITIPAGLNGQMIDYARANLAVAKQLANINQMIATLRANVGRIISIEDGIKTVSLFDQSYYLKEDLLLKETLDTLGKLRTGADFNAKAIFGDVFASNGEFRETLEYIAEAKDLINNVNKKELQSDMDTLMTYCDKLISNVNGTFSKTLIDKVATAVFCAAEHVTAYAAISFNTMMLAQVMEKNIKQLR